MNNKLALSLLLCGVFVNANAAEVITLNPVTISAEHREQALEKTAATVDVFDDKSITEQRLLELGDLNNLTSNLSIQPAGRFKTISIRGVGGGGTNAGFDTRVGVYLDGVYMGQALALGNPIFDIERVEFLKGPQGYLFGNNSDAGVVNVLTKQPSHDAERSITTGIGNYGLFENTLKLNGELTDKLTARLVLNNADRNGFVRNVETNEDLKYLWRFGARAQFKLEATDQLDLTFVADYSNYHQDWYLQQAITGLYDQPLPADTVSFDQVNQDLDPTSRVKGHGYQFNADYYFENDAKLTTILAARDWQSRLVTDIDYSPADLLSVDYQDDIRQYSQEIRYTSAKDISWPFVVGLYFLQDETQNDRLALYGQDVNTRVVLPNVPFPVPFGFAFNIQPNTPLPLDARVKSDIKAIYTNIDHRFDDYVLHLGGRYSVESKKLRYSVDGRGSGLLDLAVVDQERDRIDQTFFSPMIGLSYFVNDRTQVYAKASRAYKSGGWNAEFVDSAQFADGIEYRDESVNAYEIGYKSHDDRQQIAVSAFVNLYKDYQLFQFANLGGNTLAVQLRNAAKVKSQGIELNYKRLIGDRWILDSKLAYLDARFQSYPSARNDGSDADGERLPDAPEFSGSVSLSYQAQLSTLKNPLLMTLQNNFQTSTYSGFGDDPDTAKLGSRFIFNVYANYTTADRKWSFQLWAKNLTDKRYALTRGRSLFRNQIATFGLPRMYGINGTYHF